MLSQIMKRRAAKSVMLLVSTAVLVDGMLRDPRPVPRQGEKFVYQCRGGPGGAELVYAKGDVARIEQASFVAPYIWSREDDKNSYGLPVKNAEYAAQIICKFEPQD